MEAGELCLFSYFVIMSLNRADSYAMPLTVGSRQRARLLRRLRQRADTLGFALINRETGELLGGTVS